MLKSKKEKMEKETLKSELVNHDSDEDVISDSDTEVSDTADSSEEKLKKLEQQASEFKDMLLRKAAEFDNYKRRTESEISNVYRYASESLITELLPVLDDFDRMMKTWNDKHDAESLGKGVNLVYEKFRNVLKEQGLKYIEAEGKPFDVNLHEAIMQKESEDLNPDTVTDEIEKGYYLKDKVIRHSKVVVSKKPE